jgi:hypothetical protein
MSFALYLKNHGDLGLVLRIKVGENCLSYNFASLTILKFELDLELQSKIEQASLEFEQCCNCFLETLQLLQFKILDQAGTVVADRGLKPGAAWLCRALSS